MLCLPCVCHVPCCSVWRVALYIVSPDRVACGVAGIVCRDGIAIVRDGWQSVLRQLMRLAKLVLRSIIGIGDSLKLSVAFLNLNKKPELRCFPAFR